MASTIPENVYLYCKTYEPKIVPARKMLQHYQNVVPFVRSCFPKLHIYPFEISVDIDPEDVPMPAAAWPAFLAAQRDGYMGVVDEYTIEWEHDLEEEERPRHRAPSIRTILVKTSPEESFSVTVGADETAQSLKTKILFKEGIPIARQVLLLDDGKLEDANFLSSYGIRHMDTISLIIRPRPSTPISDLPAHPLTSRVFVENLAGEILTFRVSGSDTVEDLKHRIEDITDVPAARQRLFCAWGELEDGRTLAEEGVRRRSTVHLVLPPVRDAWKSPLPSTADPDGPIVFAHLDLPSHPRTASVFVKTQTGTTLAFSVSSSTP
ncbi:Ubiquitin [Mycena chlorophos]|uniref:Ubiquitin n=1 Tax=Mycena chlorophos TaxID=658473 RepID=A0A8H6TLH6_MYCCL|nr:Ubiquitin [Mycena chlorophos]